MPTDKTASKIIIYLIEELGDARLRAVQLQRYVADATDLIEKSEHRDHFFEVAGHLIHGIPQTLFKMSKALDASALAAARLDYEEIKQGLKPEKADELEDVMEDARLRYLNRRSNEDHMTPKEASEILNRLAAQTRVTGKVPVTPLLQLIARLEAPTGRTASEVDAMAQKAEECFREASRAILTPGEEPSRMALASLLRRVLADTMQPTSQAMAAAIFAQATSRQDVIDGFMSANPAMSKEDAEKAADEWEKNKDVVKDKTAGTAEDALRDWAGPFFRGYLRYRQVIESIRGQARADGFDEIVKRIDTFMDHYIALQESYGALVRTLPPRYAMTLDEVQAVKAQLLEEMRTAGAGEEFQKHNPAITDEQVAKINEMHEKHKDNFKTAGTLMPAAVNAFRDVLLPKVWPSLIRPVAIASGDMLDKLHAAERDHWDGAVGQALSKYVPAHSTMDVFKDDIEDVIAHWYKNAKNQLAAESMPRTASDETSEDKEARHPEGKEMTLEEVTKDMSEEDKAKFKKMHDEHGDNFKAAMLRFFVAECDGKGPGRGNCDKCDKPPFGRGGGRPGADPKPNGTGPRDEGPKTGLGLGPCGNMPVEHSYGRTAK